LWAFGALAGHQVNEQRLVGLASFNAAALAKFKIDRTSDSQSRILKRLDMLIVLC
jgi:hypothetical protein